MMKSIKNKKSQITIFVIIALIIVVSIALVFVLMKPPITSIAPERPDTIRNYIAKCTADAMQEAANEINPHGGFLAPSDYIKFNSTEAVWLCYTPFNNQVCSNKHPMLQTEAESEILEYATPLITDCFADIKNRLSNYDYKEEAMNISIRISQNRITAQINKKISYTSGGNVKSIEDFDSSINNPIYGFIRISIEAVNQEVSGCDCSQTCNADIFALNRENRDFEISRFVSGKNEEIYTIKYIATGEEFNFAVRNCVPSVTA